MTNQLVGASQQTSAGVPGFKQLNVAQQSSLKNLARLLGAAFLLQAVASALSGLLAPVNMLALSVPGNIADMMTTIANNAWRMQASLLAEMITAVGIIMLGSLLYLILQKQNRAMALVALGLYLIEVALLAASRIPAFALLRVSQESIMVGPSANLQTLGTLFYESQSFGYTLHMLLFTLGATLFYYLLFKSGYVPRALAMLGLIAAPLALVGTLLMLFGYDVPLFVFLPNLPFELGIGLWLLIKGIPNGAEMA